MGESSARCPLAQPTVAQEFHGRRLAFSEDHRRGSPELTPRGMSGGPGRTGSIVRVADHRIRNRSSMRGASRSSTALHGSTRPTRPLHSKTLHRFAREANTPGTRTIPPPGPWVVFPMSGLESCKNRNRGRSTRRATHRTREFPKPSRRVLEPGIHAIPGLARPMECSPQLPTRSHSEWNHRTIRASGSPGAVDTRLARDRSLHSNRQG